MKTVLGLGFFFCTLTALAADPPPTINIPNPSATGAAPSVTPGGGASSTPGAGIAADPNAGAAAQPTDAAKSMGRYRNANGTVKVAAMLLNRYKESVVKVTATDNAGNVLGEAMGVAAGDSHIAAPLSLILGNSIQWADKISITHHDGTQYFSNIAFVSEQLNLVILAPDDRPASIPFARPVDERPQITIFVVSLLDGAKIFEGKLSAVNQKAGTFTIAAEKADDSMAGTAVINSQGELIGMLLPKRHGVLASALSRLVDKAKKMNPFPPPMLGAVMGRGVVVMEDVPGAYPTIGKAIAAIKSGKEPKIDPTVFEVAKDKQFSPNEAERLVIKVMPGTYKEKTIEVLPYLSLSGSGPKNTTIIGTNPNEPVIRVKDGKQVNISGFRIVPAPLQESSSASVAIDGSTDVQLLGNILESKGGKAVSANASMDVKLTANVFPGSDRGEGVACKKSTVQMSANGFLGAWPQAVVAGESCVLEAERNLFMKNKVSIAGGLRSGLIDVSHNTFIETLGGVRLEGKPKVFRLENNVFFRSPYALNSTEQMADSSLGRNALWRSDFTVGGRKITSSRILRSEQRFINPMQYDFRFPLGTPEHGSASGRLKDFGAFQTDDFLGPNSTYFADALEVATGEKNLVSAWGVKR